MLDRGFGAVLASAANKHRQGTGKGNSPARERSRSRM